MPRAWLSLLRWIHLHHIVPREHGGNNDPWNLVCLCPAHHQALHRQQIALTGRAPDALVFDVGRYDAPWDSPATSADAGPLFGVRGSGKEESRSAPA
ncbi:MAG: HNH endonuclease [Deltaproteobacteria bacterium]|nr:HNH endonuclease [Kofleriaceae bacterium]